MFYGRKEELNEIHNAINSNRFESILIYGRRRIGKTMLIDEAIKDSQKRVLRYECKKTTIYQNLVLLSKTVLDFFNETITDYIFEDYHALFDYIFKKSCEEDFIFIIDEFSFLLDSKDAIDSELAIAIDQYKNSSKMKLIISGSYVMLLKKMISANAHLFGRFTHIISLKALDYQICANFYPKYSNEDKIKMYSVFGGVPYFNSLINPDITADENIINLVVRMDSILEHEINEVVLNETNKINEMNLIIELIASGVNKYTDMKMRLSKDNVRMDYYLNKLIDMEIIEKIAPINDAKNKKKMFYVFKDNLMHFYYLFVFKNMNMRNVMNPNDFYNLKIREELEKSYIPLKFETISKEYLIIENKKGNIKPVFYDIGTYFFNDAKRKKNIQLDIVTQDEKGYISYECKYTNSKIDQKVIEEEISQTRDIGMNIYKLGFISKSGFDSSVNQDLYHCISLSQMY